MIAFAQIVKCLLPCGWSLLILIGVALMISSTNNKVYFMTLPADYHLYNKERKKAFWNTSPKREKAKLKILIVSPIIWIVGVIFIFIFSTFKVVPVAASQPTGTATPTFTVTNTRRPTSTPAPLLDPPSKTPDQYIPSVTAHTPTRQPTATPRIIYQSGPVQVVTVLVEHMRPVVITQLVTVEVTVIVTPTFTETPIASETFTETPTETLTDTPTETPTPTFTETIP